MLLLFPCYFFFALLLFYFFFFFFFQAEDGIRDLTVTGVQTCALPIWIGRRTPVTTPLRWRRCSFPEPRMRSGIERQASHLESAPALPSSRSRSGRPQPTPSPCTGPGR